MGLAPTIIARRAMTRDRGRPERFECREEVIGLFRESLGSRWGSLGDNEGGVGWSRMESSVDSDGEDERGSRRTQRGRPSPFSYLVPRDGLEPPTPTASTWRSSKTELPRRFAVVTPGHASGACRAERSARRWYQGWDSNPRLSLHESAALTAGLPWLDGAGTAARA